MQSSLYIGMVVGLMALWIASLGGGIWGQQGYWGLHWQHLMFEGMCHQLPQRSFWIGNQPMAVCTRCFGIYTSLLVSSILLPCFFSAARLSKRYLKYGALLVVGINVADVCSSIFGIWENIPFTRFLLGMGIGGIMILFLINKSDT